MKEDFEFWWDKEGQYSELCGKELCLIAWSNGEYKATYPANTYENAIEECAKRAEAYAYMSENFNVLADELRAILKKASEK